MLGAAASELKLTEDELAFLRFTCSLFFLPESPLYIFELERREPKLFGPVHESLSKRGLVDPDTWRGKDEALVPVQTVCECDARVLWQRYDGEKKQVRDFYVANNHAVEFRRDLGAGAYFFGAVARERDMVKEVVKHFVPAPTGKQLINVTFSPGEYLVFAVFARDVRAPKKEAPKNAMTMEEVLACFDDEPGASHIPQDSDFQKHTAALLERGLLLGDQSGGHTLSAQLHEFARGLSSETYDAFTRYDFIDEDWLIRETTVYPVPQSIFLLSSLADGSVNVQELDQEQLYEVIAQAIATLPDVSDNPARPRFAKDFFLRA